jgi:hypothetical protein
MCTKTCYKMQSDTIVFFLYIFYIYPQAKYSIKWLFTNYITTLPYDEPSVWYNVHLKHNSRLCGVMLISNIIAVCVV